MSINNLHDGKELELLLRGDKPLAAFSYYEGADESSVLGKQDFASAVIDGRLLRFDQKMQFEGNSVAYVLFALPSECWRAQAYLHIKKFMFERDWCAHLEWIEGSLLGYSDAQNSVHMRQKYGPNRPALPCKPERN